MTRKTMLRSINPNHISDISLAHNSMIWLGAATLLGRGDLGTDSWERARAGRPATPIGGDPLSMPPANWLIAAASMSEVSILLDLQYRIGEAPSPRI